MKKNEQQLKVLTDIDFSKEKNYWAIYQTRIFQKQVFQNNLTLIFTKLSYIATITNSSNSMTMELTRSSHQL